MILISLDHTCLFLFFSFSSSFFMILYFSACPSNAKERAAPFIALRRVTQGNFIKQ
uniref:Uncharacterized protein n=1 Tax=Rhizophora mucronata TaxID=61149 RepID=A0A2P2R064_RHIMU